MHVLSVPVEVVCIQDILRDLSTQKALDHAHRLNSVRRYQQILRSGGKIDCAPIPVRQTNLGYLHVEKQDYFEVCYVIACYLSGKPVLVKIRKPLRPAPWFRSGAVLPACMVSRAAIDESMRDAA